MARKSRIPNDLALSKLVAGREKDLEFVRGLFQHAMADPRRVARLLDTLATSADVLRPCHSRLDRITSSSS